MLQTCMLETIEGRSADDEERGMKSAFDTNNGSHHHVVFADDKSRAPLSRWVSLHFELVEVWVDVVGPCRTAE